MVKITFQDLMRVKQAQKEGPPKRKLRKKPVKVGSLSPEAKNTIRYILADRLMLHKTWAKVNGKEVWMRAQTLAEWFVTEMGDKYPGYNVNVLLTIMMDANETGSPILRIARGKYVVNEEIYGQCVLPRE